MERYSVYANFFDALGVKAELGRTFQKGEDEPGRDQVVLLRHSFWQRRFGSDPNILGKTLTLNGKAFTVIGVMPAGFNFPVNDGQIWIPLTFDEKEKRNHKRAMSGLGLLKPGISARSASAELDSIWRKAQEIYPDLYAGLSTQVVGMTEDYVRNTKMYMPPLIGAVAFILLIVCANVANMLLGRALGQRKEIAVRLALGASRRRVIGQMLIESLLLALGGGFTGLLLSVWTVKLLKGMMPESLTIFIPGFERLGINSAALLFTLLISALTAIFFGLAPAWRSSRPNLNEDLKEGMKGASSADLRGRPRSLLVIAEVALSLVLLIGAGLMFRSFTAMLRDDLGFKPENLLSFQMMVSGGVEKRRGFYDRLLKRLEALPGVTATGASDALPMSGNQNAVIKIVGRPPSEKDEKTFVDYRVVTPGYFNTIGMPLRRGRDFTTGDHERALRVVIVNESFARRFFPNQEAIGQRLVAFGEIVGIVGDAREDNLDKVARPGFYVPFAQEPMPFMGVVLRSTVDRAALATAVRNEVARLDPAQSIFNFKTMEQRIYERTAPKRIMTVMMGVVAWIALLLAGIGLYAVMAYSVSQRTHEIGIRLALGAQTGAVLRLVVAHGMKLALLGVGFGLISAFGLTRLMKGLLFGVSAFDPLTFVATPLLLTGVALLACYFPARRATKVDPLIALRTE